MALWMPNTIGFGVLSLSNVIDVSSAVSELYLIWKLQQITCISICSSHRAVVWRSTSTVPFLSLCPSHCSLSLYGWLGYSSNPFVFLQVWNDVKVSKSFFTISQVCTKQHSSSLSTTVLPWTRVVFNTVCHQLNSSLIKHVRSVTLKPALFIVDYVWACSFLLNSALTFWLNVC